jgi:hypothetical protein
VIVGKLNINYVLAWVLFYSGSSHSFIHDGFV